MKSITQKLDDTLIQAALVKCEEVSGGPRDFWEILTKLEETDNFNPSGNTLLASYHDFIVK